MEAVPTFVNGNFVGLKSLKEAYVLEGLVRENALKKQKKEDAAQVLYSYKCYDEITGDIAEIRLYDGLTLTETELRKLTRIIPDAIFGVIHARQ